MKFIDVFVKDMQLDLEILAFHIMTHIFRCLYIVNRFISRSYIHAWLHLTFSGKNLGLQNNSKAYRSLGIFHTESFFFLKVRNLKKYMPNTSTRTVKHNVQGRCTCSFKLKNKVTRILSLKFHINQKQIFSISKD